MFKLWAVSSRNCLHSVVGSIHSCSNMCMGTSLTILWRQVKRNWFCVDMTAYQKHRMPNRRFSVYLLTQIAVVTEKTTLSCRPPTATFTAWGPQLKNVTLKWIKLYRNRVPASDSLHTVILFSSGISANYAAHSPLWYLAKDFISYGRFTRGQ